MKLFTANDISSTSDKTIKSHLVYDNMFYCFNLLVTKTALFSHFTFFVFFVAFVVGNKNINSLFRIFFYLSIY